MEWSDAVDRLTAGGVEAEEAENEEEDEQRW